MKETNKWLAILIVLVAPLLSVIVVCKYGFAGN
ncbi:hypothetical protein ACM55F_03295 [Flavobacterium sp. XS2P12]